MQLYTICVRDLPVVTLSTDAQAPVPEHFKTDPEMMKLIRDSDAHLEWLRQMTALLPGPDLGSLRELDEAIETYLGEDLMSFGLWSGNTDDLHFREARIDEAERWYLSRREAINSEELDAGNEDWLLFLVPVKGMVAKQKGAAT